MSCKVKDTNLFSSTATFLVYECENMAIYISMLFFFAFIQLVRHWTHIQSTQVHRETLSTSKLKDNKSTCGKTWDNCSQKCCQKWCRLCLKHKNICCCDEDEFKGLCSRTKRPLCKLVLLTCLSTFLWIISILFILSQNIGILITALFANMLSVYALYKTQRSDHRHILAQINIGLEQENEHVLEFRKKILKIVNEEETDIETDKQIEKDVEKEIDIPIQNWLW